MVHIFGTNKSIDFKAPRLFTSYFCMLLVLFLMILAAELFGEKEIIFPEIAALSVGCFIAPKLAWSTSYVRMLACISICAILGVLIVIFVPLPLWVQFVLAFMLGQLILFFSRTSFAPMISAISLPVLVQTRGAIYIVAAFFLTLVVILLRLLLEKRGAKPVEAYSPVNVDKKEYFTGFAFRSILVLFIAFLCIRFDVKFCVAPPLLVAFTELTNKKSVALSRWMSVVLLVTLCAFAGAVSRYILCMLFGFPLWSAVVPICLYIILFVKFFGLLLPPAAAMGILALLIPEDCVIMYPLEVFAGILVLTLFAVIYRKFFVSRIFK